MSEVKQNYYVYYSGYTGGGLQEHGKVLRDVETTEINEIWAMLKAKGIYCNNNVVVYEYDCDGRFTITTIEIWKEKNNKKPSKEDFMEWMAAVQGWGTDYDGDCYYEEIANETVETKDELIVRIEKENTELKKKITELEKENAELKKKITELEKEKNA
tara:strand:+ start:19 stop:492 length:474 start_codon:yes stop_codon:yes gene_type:complete